MVYYKPKKLSEINLKRDSMIAAIGKISETRDNSFILDDGTKKIEIFSDEAVESGKLVRVFCSVAENQLKANIIQQLNDFDLDLFYKVKELYSKSGV